MTLQWKHSHLLGRWEGGVVFNMLFVLFLATLRAMWDLSSPIRDQTCALYTGRQSLNHWTAREVPVLFSEV